MESTYRVGDWVRFYRNGQMVIAVVQYLTHDACGFLLLATDLGEVRISHVLEGRSRLVAEGD